jgi:hypothetical protein
MFQLNDSKIWNVAAGSSHTRGNGHCVCCVLQGGRVKDEKCIVMVVSSLSCFVIATVSLPIVYIMTNPASLPCLHEWASYHFTLQKRKRT